MAHNSNLKLFTVGSYNPHTNEDYVSGAVFAKNKKEALIKFKKRQTKSTDREFYVICQGRG